MINTEYASSETIDPRDLILLLYRNSRIIVVSVVLCVLIAGVLAFTLPKTYKSSALLNIKTSYFQNPLVSDIITEVDSQNELQAQRTSLIRMALDEEFVDSIGNKYEFYSDSEDVVVRGRERELLFDRIEYFSTNSSTFQLGFSDRKAETARNVASDVLEKIKGVLTGDRYEKLKNTREALEQHIRVLAGTLKGINKNEKPNAAYEELEKIETTLASLRLKFTEKHPEIVKLKHKAGLLKRQLKDTPQNPGDKILEGNELGGLLAPGSRESVENIYFDLMQKLSNLMIVLDMEEKSGDVSYLSVVEKPQLPSAPVFPNKKLFVAGGMGLGLLIAVIIITLNEVISQGAGRGVGRIGQLLDAPHLGEIPAMATVIRELPETEERTALPDSDRADIKLIETDL